MFAAVTILQGVIFEFFSRALLSPELEKESGMDHLHSQTCPADIQVPPWSIGKSAACDVTVVNPLNPSLILGVSTTVGYSAAEKEVVKMTKNGQKCAELRWECIPLVVETYGWWLGREGPGNIQPYQQEVGNGFSRQGSRGEAGHVRETMPDLGEGELYGYPGKIQLAFKLNPCLLYPFSMIT